ncbi:exodeoxyribonuclease VII large subunit [Burkholderiales bacterium]|nr:exodeoxyribonuclease VII large subunit [Burkholderiales bacterium]
MSENGIQSEVLSVSQVTRTIKSLIESHLPEIWVRGEISNFVRAASGHSYFSLKDESSQVRCVLFRSRMSNIEFEIKNGLEVELLAAPSMFEKRGEFQLIAQVIRKSGLGRLFELYEAQKRKFAAEGLFDASKKTPLIRFPQKIGVVTSLDAAALRDVCKTLADRAPNVSVIIYPSPVQGVGAGKKLAEAVILASERCEVDGLIVCRGGGSLEDLWEFNSEELIRAIASCPIPVVSGVGHETDTTLIDFVSDHRAPTPTAAANAVVSAFEEIALELQRFLKRLTKNIRAKVDANQQHIDYLNRRLIHPGKRNVLYGYELDRLANRLNVGVHRLIRGQVGRLNIVQSQLSRLRPDGTRSLRLIEDYQKRMHREILVTLNQLQGRLSSVRSSLSHLDPEQVLSRGYSIVRNNEGDILRSTKSVSVDDRLTVQLSDGELDTLITTKRLRQS